MTTPYVRRWPEVSPNDWFRDLTATLMAQGVSLSTLAHETGLSRHGLRDWLGGRRELQKRSLERVARWVRRRRVTVTLQ